MSGPTSALASWKGAFGDEYISRNTATTQAMSDAVGAFSRILAELPEGEEPQSILEVGANVGINLKGLSELQERDFALSAVEPNPRAAKTLHRDTEIDLSGVVRADGAKLPFREGSFDLVFTKGVLIHVPPPMLDLVMSEVHRVSRRWVLCIEYFSHKPEEVEYRGHSGLLWKRDFGRSYLETCPGLVPHAYGFLWDVEYPTFDNSNWWMFRKQ